MSLEIYEKTIEGNLLADCSQRAKWSFTGSDRVRYLNGQVTNDVKTLSPSQSLWAAVCNVKAKMDGDVRISASADALYVDADITLRESLTARFEKYIIADDVQLEDITDQWQLFHSCNSQTSFSWPADAMTFSSQRYGTEGKDIWFPSEKTFSQIATTSDEVMEFIRIKHLIAAWGKEMTSDTLPPEALPEALAISYKKGCYIGQEIISRIKSIGKVNKKLCLVSCQNSDNPPSLPLDCYKENESEKKIGTLSSVIRTNPTLEKPGTEQLLGLATLQRSFLEKKQSFSCDEKLWSVIQTV